MAVFKIPTANGEAFPNYQIEVELDGVPYRIDLRYNSRQDSWFLTLRDINGVILRGGISVVSGFPLFKRMKQLSRPDGVTLAVPVALDNIDAADLMQLGNDVILTYVGET